MKFTLILTVFLALVFAMAQAAPTPTVGPKVWTLGVRFQDQYQTLVGVSQAVVSSYEGKIASFNEELPVAAKADGTPVAPFLIKWSKNYADLVAEYKSVTKKLDEKIKVLKKHLGD